VPPLLYSSAMRPKPSLLGRRLLGKRRALLAVVAAALLTSVVPFLPSAEPAPASAADNGLWSVFPTTGPGAVTARGYFQPLLSPGVIYQDSVSVTNKTAQPLNFDLYAADAYNTVEGGFALRTQNQPKLDMGAWIHLPVSNVTVAAHSVEIVPFFILPPSDATPGDHTGGIVALNTIPEVSSSGALSVRQLQAVGTRVYGRVKGPITPSLSVTHIQVVTHTGVVGLLGGPVDSDITYTVVNTGNIRLDPTSAVSVSPLIGPSTNASPVNLPELLPHGSARVHLRVNGVVPVVHMTVHMKETSAAPTTVGVGGAWVIPWLLILIIVIIVLWILWRRRRRRQKEGEPAPPVARAGGGGSTEPVPVSGEGEATPPGEKIPT
jgi:hypothetical protein